jgi:hypothetical protein
LCILKFLNPDGAFFPGVVSERLHFQASCGQSRGGMDYPADPALLGAKLNLENHGLINST